MKLIQLVLILISVGACTADMEHAATTEISVEQGTILIKSLESAGLTGFSSDEIESVINDIQPNHSFLLENDVTLDGATRTVQIAIQKVSDQRVEFSILSHNRRLIEKIQAIMDSTHGSRVE